MLGQEPTAPIEAIRLAERAQFILDHPGWTFEDYDNAAAGDLLFLTEYQKMAGARDRQLLEKARAQHEPD